MKKFILVALCAATPVLPAQQPRVERYTFSLQLPDAGRHIRGEALARLGAPPTVDMVAFDLDAAMHVRAVAFGCDDQVVAARFEHIKGQLRVAIPPRAEGGGRGTAGTECIRISYDGEPGDGLIIGTDSAGRWTAFGDNFPNRARYWLPTMDHPSQKAKVTFVVTAPAGRAVVANGVQLTLVQGKDGRATTTWREDRPIPTYAMVIGAGPLTMHDLGQTACGLAEDGGCVPQMVWTAPEQAKYMPGQFARSGAIVEFYSRTIGAFPYEKLAHLQTATRYGGMENSSAIFYADRIFRRPNGIDVGLIAHETAHQWFGDAVTEREWAHAWLSEGFATFFAALWTQHADGDSAYRAELSRLRREVISATVASERAVIDSVETDPNRLLNANTYQKGGWVLHMLRAQIGDSAFFAGLRGYFAEYRHGNAMTQDLQRTLEKASGRDLGWFFDQWLRRPGWAQLRTAWQWDATTRHVTLDVEQEPRFGAYRLPLTIDIQDATGAHQRVTVEVEARSSQRVVLPVEFATAPRGLTFDPDVALLAAIVSR